MAIYVFISYSSRNKSQVRYLAKDLKRFGIEVWLDEWKIKIGDPITQKIQKGIEDCDYILVWLTKDSVKSGWVAREWQAKYNEEVKTKKIKVLPLLAEKCQIPKLLSDKKYANFTDDYSAGLTELLATLLNDEFIANKEILINKIIEDFRIGDDSYSNLVRNLSAFIRMKGTIGLELSMFIIQSYMQDIRQIVTNECSKLTNKSNVIPQNLDPFNISFHYLFQEYGKRFTINPFHVPCSFHPCIHLTAALLIIEEEAGNEFINPNKWYKTLKQLFSCLDFWIAFFMNNGGMHPPQERLLKDLMVCCGSINRALKNKELPPFLLSLMDGDTSIPTLATDYEITGFAVDENGNLLKVINDKRRQAGAMSVSGLAKYLFG